MRVSAHLGSVQMNGEEHKLWGFAFTLGYSRTMMAEAALDQKLGTLPSGDTQNRPSVDT
jgi:transposase